MFMPPQDFIRKNLYTADTSYKPQMLDVDLKRGHYSLYNFGKSKPASYETKSEIDVDNYTFKYWEEFDGQKVSHDENLSLDEYLNKRKQEISDEMSDSISQSYNLKKALSGGDLARMIASSTGFSIPLPPNPVTSIFGSPKISLNVNGQVNVRIGWRWDTRNLGTVSRFGQTQSTPIFSQDIRVNVSGGIGDKLKISTDWNTRRNFDLDNQFKIGFEGEDDDIIKLIEVGNVSFPTNNSLIGGGTQLFGVRADFQFGPVFIKSVLSQRRGQRGVADIRGGENRIPFQIRAYDYATNYFFIDEEYKQVWKDYYKNTTPVLPVEYDTITVKEIEVWEITNQQTNTQVREGIAHAVLPKIGRGQNYDASFLEAQTVQGKVHNGRFQLLDSTRYDFDYTLGVLRIESLSPDRVYAVSYRLQGPTQAGPQNGAGDDDLRVGNLSTESGFEQKLVLKLVYAPNMQPGFEEIWSRQLRNIYNIGTSNINASTADINVWYLQQSNDSVDVLQGSPEKLVTILGVDRVNLSGQVTPDGQFDKVIPYFDSQRGEIRFPSLEPFREGLIDYFSSINKRQLANNYIFPDVYDTNTVIARQNTARDRFIIAGNVSGSSRNRINLRAFNIDKNSIRVTLDGAPLKQFQDWTFEPLSSSIQLRNPRAMLPNANVRVEYEKQDIFQVSTKTLAGLRVDYNLFNTRRINSNLGFTFMYYNQSAVVDQVTLGQEPVQNTMLGLDWKVNWDTPFITKALDLLPFYDTKAKSSLDLNSEWAMMIPEPNKRKSSIPSDRGESVVYIDNFEQAQRRITLGLNPTLWSHSSAPRDSTLGIDGFDRNNHRGRMYWFQRFVPWVPRRTVYPNIETAVGANNLTPLEVFFEPQIRGIYNRNAEFVDEFNPNYNPVQFEEFQNRREPGFEKTNRERTWGGMQRLFSSFNTNLDNENIEFVEIMMYITEADASTEVYLDLGQISEDIIPNGLLDTEDGITQANPLPNDQIDDGEDLGIDAASNEDERSSENDEIRYPFPLNLEDDPARDDYFFNFDKDIQLQDRPDFVKYNNFENNALQSEVGTFPDREVLNTNNGQTVSLDDSYFRYKLNVLNRDVNTNSQIVGGNPDAGWYLFRIPIRKPTSQVGNPLFSNIQYIRLTAQGGSFGAYIADWALVGSQWQRINNFQSNVSPDDSVMQVSFINVFENGGAPDFYTMPPGVRPPRQINSPNPQQNIRLNEQSLRICTENLRYGEERMAIRIFNQQDLFYYKKLKFFIHGDESMPIEIPEGSIPKGEVFLRFGIDSSNYYEYRMPITRDWKDIEIDLPQLTRIKQIRDQTRITDRQEFPTGNDDGSVFAIKGTPILTRVSFFGIGVANPEQRFPNDLSTCIWLDELRLIDAEDSRDMAALTTATLKLADLGSINASFNIKEGNFHQIEERFGDRNNRGEFAVAMQGNLERFAPKSFKGMKLPINYTHSEKLTTPEFIANSDINLEEAANLLRLDTLSKGATQGEADAAADSLKKRSENLIVQDSWALTGVKLGIPISHWTVMETINKINFNYSYAQQYERTPVYENRFNWNWNFDMTYANTIPEILTLSPYGFLETVPVLNNYSKFKINFLPSNIGWNIGFARMRQTEQSRFLNFASPIVRDFTANRKANFSWKLISGGFINPTFDYNFDTRSTLLPFEIDETGAQRTDREIANEMLFNNGIIDFGQNTQHNQTVTINFNPVLPNLFNISKFFDMNGSYSSNYTWNNPLQPDPRIRDAAKNASYNTNLRFKGDLRLKSLADNWWGITPGRGGGGRARKNPKDSSSSNGGGFFNAVGRTFKFIFLDFENIGFRFSQTKNATNPGVLGGEGMHNFWARGMAFRPSEAIFGPSFAYQMGLVSNPHGSIDWRSPFDFGTDAGLRPALGRFQDNLRESTDLDMSTSRPLWKGATLDLNWRTRLGFNRNQTVLTDENGVPTFTNIIAQETFERTFISMPKIFGVNIFGNTVEDVVALYEERAAIIDADQNLDSLDKNKQKNFALAQAFYEGLETFSLSGTGRVGKFLPSLNWGIRWSGLEEWSLWRGYVKKIQVDHRYQSTYQEAVQITDNGRSIQNQQVMSGFQPLVGVTMSFDESKIGGTLTGTVKWNRTQGYNLNLASKSVITSQVSNEITINAAYTMDSFEFDLIGLKLENELEISFNGSYKYNGRGTFDVFDPASFEGGQEQGRVLDGSTVIMVEPRIRYSLSQRVTASFFVRYDGTFNEGAASPGFSTTQVGFDFRLSIAGGR
jgi:cell surface protein SprA